MALASAGYTSAHLIGQGITDRLLATVAGGNPGALTHIRIISPQLVTDRGIGQLIAANPNVKELHAEGFVPNSATLSQELTGSFLPAFLNIPDVERLVVAHMAAPALRWGLLQQELRLLPLQQRLTSLRLWKCGLDGEPDALRLLLSKLPCVTSLAITAGAEALCEVAAMCPALESLTYYLESNDALETALTAEPSLADLATLRRVELIVAKSTAMAPFLLRFLGYVNLEELSLVSESFQSHPNINMRSQISHVSGDGIRALVDSFCERYQQQPGVYRPLKLSLIGACALGHDSVSALLRLPLLTELNITGCNKISAMDKMRLVAKVKAGREFLEAKGIVIDRTWGDEFNTDFSLSAWKAN